MKRIAYFLILTALVSPIFAGEGHKCTADAQTCINKIAKDAMSKGWMGIELDEAKYETALVITKVIPGSPAEKAELKPGDTLVALNGVKYKSDEAAMKEVYKQVKPGNVVTYTVGDSHGKQREVKLTLGKMPEEVIAKWLGSHMLSQHAEVAYIN